MIDLGKYNLADAELRFTLANSPTFLIDGLRMDREVKLIAVENSGEELMTTLKKAVASKATTLLEQVAPFVLLSAIYLKGDRDALSQATSYASQISDWLSIASQFYFDQIPGSQTTVTSYKSMIPPTQNALKILAPAASWSA